MNDSPVEERFCDVLVIGSGAAGLAAAVTAAHSGLKVIVAEKAEMFGGTSAWSGGWLWIPHNPLAVRGGINEDREEPRRYLRSELGNRANDPRIEVFLANGPEMVRFFEDETAVEWIDGNAVPDFHATPGSVDGGRSISAKPFDGRRLGPFVNKLRPPLDVVSLWGMGIAAGKDMGHFFNATRNPRSTLYAAGRIGKHLWDLARFGRGMQLVNGNALVARLIRSALDLQVTLIDSAPATKLLEIGGRVTGARLATGAGEMCIHAARGVVLATGGFPHDPKRIAQMLDHAPDGSGHYSAAPRSNSGDGIRLAESVGARIETSLDQPGAWAPVSLVPGTEGAKHFPHLVERAKPGFIAVDSGGKRFVNEADSYHDFMKALLDRTPRGTKPFAWLICDHRAQRRFGLGWAKPFPFPVGPYVANGYLKRGQSIAELAKACDLPVSALEVTLARFNAAARLGKDPDFNRGVSTYNRVQGDAGHKPNPALGALETGPFYAVRIVPGSLGTFAGLPTSPRGEVHDPTGKPIPGLFSVGNDMSSIFGGNYPSGGITLGPGMTFGFVVGRLLAGEAVVGVGPLDQPETENSSKAREST
ncbi:FAD-dependent oxidoreductase [Mariluticola halotolerans]|uniref:FAD-dependent oxidoreductase n=1 Tax=Mariluticola halotolerans TaxID=2909283 RepID=UPI0026E22762|nr:FAD-dependent oxidoreductase [Mariluticola halotolerans]UJQ94107.1 FAD-dependent oxidoreductase [Mariluticola halotolerans]